MAYYELDEEASEKIRLEAGVGYILLEDTVGPEGWDPTDRDTEVWTPVPRVSIT